MDLKKLVNKNPEPDETKQAQPPQRGKAPDGSQPHDIMAEQGVLGSITLKPGVLPELKETVGKGDFYRKKHGILWQTMSELWDEKGTIDLIVLRDVLKEKGKLEAVGGVAYLQEIMEAVPTSLNAGYYAEIVKEKSARRLLYRAGHRMRTAAGDEQSDPSETMAKVIGWLESQNGSNSKSIISAADAVDKARERWEREEEAGYSVLSTGINPLDEAVGGPRAGELWTIMGKSHSGKTAFASQLILNMCKSGHRCLFYETEMNAGMMADNWACHLGEVNTRDVRRSRLDEYQMENYVDGMAQIEELPLLIDDRTARLDKIMNSAIWQNQKENVAAIVIDHAQRLKVAQKSNSIWEKMSTVATEIKLLARKTDAAIILLSQVTRMPDGTWKPRGGEELRNESDVMMSIRFPEDYVFGETELPDYTYRDLVISKGRGIGSWKKRLGFYGPNLKFSYPYSGPAQE